MAERLFHKPQCALENCCCYLEKLSSKFKIFFKHDLLVLVAIVISGLCVRGSGVQYERILPRSGRFLLWLCDRSGVMTLAILPFGGQPESAESALGWPVTCGALLHNSGIITLSVVTSAPVASRSDPVAVDRRPGQRSE
ncbi:hypothetical protein AAG570_009637 [Ranatra chinensis]|uniref:Uncharacterized protein n=1 Tax=Ranatra chinensis TaxID=642074 RepID=A0ABD0YPT2_9HEMI